MKRIGVNDYTLDDWANIAKICFEREESTGIWLKNSRQIRMLASLLGQINITNSELIQNIPLLEEYKKQYVNLRNQGKSIGYIQDRDSVLNHIMDCDKLPEELLEKIALAYRKYSDETRYWTIGIIEACKEFEQEINQYLDYDIMDFVTEKYGANLVLIEGTYRHKEEILDERE